MGLYLGLGFRVGVIAFELLAGKHESKGRVRFRVRGRVEVVAEYVRVGLRDGVLQG